MFIYNNISKLITHNKDGFVYDQFKFAARSSEGGLSFPYETKIHIMEHYDNEEMADTVYKPVYEYFNQINLGLLERREADIGVMKDLYIVYADSLVNWILYVKNNCNSLPVFIALTISLVNWFS